MDFLKATMCLVGLVCACASAGCQGDSGTQQRRLPSPAGAGGSDESADGAAGASSTGTPFQRDGDQVTLESEPFTIQPGEEKYMCWTTTSPDALKVASYFKSAQPYVHHLVFATPTKMEPEGIRDCDAAFQLSWSPLFAAGAGDVELKFPAGVVQSIGKGAQMLMQLHLVNTSDKPVTDTVKLTMTTTDAEDTQSVRFAVFGDTDVSLPPGEEQSVVAECQTPATTRVVGFFPHMHLLGTSMRLELGASADDMQTFYERTPYDFNDQRIDSTDTMMQGGLHARLTCNYKNTTQNTVVYGESTFNEMCYLIVFVVGAPTGCIRGSVSPIGGGGVMPGPMGGGTGGAASTGGCADVELGPGIVMPGCCTQGMCGGDVSKFASGVGCVELSQIAAGAAQMGTMLSVPAPHACPSP
jgi:hypothetical protein